MEEEHEKFIRKFPNKYFKYLLHSTTSFEFDISLYFILYFILLTRRWNTSPWLFDDDVGLFLMHARRRCWCLPN
jgi:hypothetical protein